MGWQVRIRRKSHIYTQKLKSMAIISIGATGVFSGLCVRSGNEKFYNEVLMPLNRLIPPEVSHNLAVIACKYNIFPEDKAEPPELLKTSFLGYNLDHPIGIAAGFDKQGEAIVGLNKIGFSMVEIGSVTPLPQPGNPKPRVFRLTEDKAIINRYGFNSDGHEEVLQRLIEMRDQHKIKGLLGVNLGKNKTSENALEDYARGVIIFSPIADYLVINVSSPNTPGLRNLQAKDDLRNLLRGVLKTRANLPEHLRKPILLKLAPDLTKEDCNNIASVLKNSDCKVDGLIISNTTIDKTNLKNAELSKEAGGLSGEPLTQKSTQLIAEMYSLTKGKFPIIGVGGIFSGKDAYEKIQAGASVLQIYTSFIYHGPPVLKKIKMELSEELKQNGYSSVSEAVGKNFKTFLRK